MPPIPLKSRAGSRRSAIYRDFYSTAQAAEFANVPKATVYRAKRVGQLKLYDWGEGNYQPPRIAHTDLLAWMAERGFPVPKKRVPKWPDYLSPAKAMEYTNSKQGAFDDALKYGALQKVAKPDGKKALYFSREQLDHWVRRGKPVNAEDFRPPPPCAVTVKVEALLEEAGMSRQELYRAMYITGKWSPHSVQLMLRGDTVRTPLEILADAAAVLGQWLGRPIQLSELVDWRPSNPR